MRRLLLLAGALTALASVPVEAATLKVVGFLPARSISNSMCMEPWLAAIKPELGDEVEFQTYWGGTLGRNPTKQYDLVLDGIADVAYFLPGYTPGRFPDFGVFELPYLVRSGAEAGLAQRRMFDKGHLGGLEKSHVLGFYATDPNVLNLREPISSLDDVEGRKIRTAGPVYSSFVKSLGAVPVAMPVTEMTEALQRGLVDGTVLGWSGARVFRLQSVVDFHYSAPFGVSPLAVVMNKDKWNGLSAKARAVFEKHGGDEIAKLCGGAFDDDADRSRKIMMDAGNKVYQASAEEIDKGLARTKPVHDEWIEGTENGQKKYDDLKNILADLRAGRM